MKSIILKETFLIGFKMFKDQFKMALRRNKLLGYNEHA